MHPLQAGQGLVPDDSAPHRQIAAFDQRQPQITRQIRLFVIGFVVRAGGQQHDQRYFTVAQRCSAVTSGSALTPPVGQAVAHRVEKSAQMLDLQFTQQIRKGACNDGPIFQRIAGARRRLRPVGNDPPAPVRSPGQIDCIKVQSDAVFVLQAVAGPQETGMTMDQRRRQQPLFEQLLLAIHIDQDMVQKRGSLDHRRLDSGPLAVWQDERQDVQIPGSLYAFVVGINVVSGAVFANLTLHRFDTLAHHLGRFSGQTLQYGAPVPARLVCSIEHLIETAGRGAVAGEQAI